MCSEEPHAGDRDEQACCVAEERGLRRKGVCAECRSNRALSLAFKRVWWPVSPSPEPSVGQALRTAGGGESLTCVMPTLLRTLGVNREPLWVPEPALWWTAWSADWPTMGEARCRDRGSEASADVQTQVGCTEAETEVSREPPEYGELQACGIFLDHGSNWRPLHWRVNS